MSITWKFECKHTFLTHPLYLPIPLMHIVIDVVTFSDTCNIETLTLKVKLSEKPVAMAVVVYTGFRGFYVFA